MALIVTNPFVFWSGIPADDLWDPRLSWSPELLIGPGGMITQTYMVDAMGNTFFPGVTIGAGTLSEQNSCGLPHWSQLQSAPHAEYACVVICCGERRLVLSNKGFESEFITPTESLNPGETPKEALLRLFTGDKYLSTILALMDIDNMNFKQFTYKQNSRVHVHRVELEEHQFNSLLVHEDALNNTRVSKIRAVKKNTSDIRYPQLTMQVLHST